MTTQVIRKRVSEARRHERRSLWQKTVAFFFAISELVDMSFAPGAHLSHLESEYRATLTLKERLQSDAYMNGIG